MSANLRQAKAPVGSVVHPPFVTDFQKAPNVRVASIPRLRVRFQLKSLGSPQSKADIFCLVWLSDPPGEPHAVTLAFRLVVPHERPPIVGFVEDYGSSMQGRVSGRLIERVVPGVLGNPNETFPIWRSGNIHDEAMRTLRVQKHDVTPPWECLLVSNDIYRKLVFVGVQASLERKANVGLLPGKRK
jgi:hypothetical protein